MPDEPAPPQYAPTAEIPTAPPTPPPYVVDDSRAPSRPGWGSVIAISLVAALIGGVLGAGLIAVRDRNRRSDRVGLGRIAPGRSSAIARAGDVRGILRKVEPAVVSIRTEAFAGDLFGVQRVRGAGTGMILSPDGRVLTNNHVIEGATSIEVTVQGESKSRVADVVGSSPDNDIALLRIRDAQDLPTVTLGRSDDLQVGDDVVAIGNALALEGGPTVTRGIVSALHRSLPETKLTNLVQTDAAINAGNSGGPLVNSQGEVVGINTAVIQNSGGREVQNIGFAIAIDAARPVIEDVGNGKAPVGSQAFLGVATEDGSGGAVVVNVQPGSPADEAGLRAGDVITNFGGEGVGGAAELVSKVRAHKAGDKVDVVWKRGGSEQKASVTLTSRQVRTG